MCWARRANSEVVDAEGSGVKVWKEEKNEGTWVPIVEMRWVIESVAEG